MNLAAIGKVLATSLVALVLIFLWGLTVLGVLSSTRNRRLPPGEKILWVALAVALPFMGAFLYMLARISGRIAAPPRPEAPIPTRDMTEVQLPPMEMGYSQPPAWANQPPRPPAYPRTTGYQLSAVEGPCKGSTFSLDQLPARIGRGGDATIRLEDDYRISRQHAELYDQGGAICIRDLGSMHGTSVNGQPASGQRLSAGDTIKAGDSVLVFERVR